MQFGKRNTDKGPKKPRQSYQQENYPDEEYGEMIYTDPNGNQVLSPMDEPQDQMMDSEFQRSRQTYPRNDYRYNPEMAQLNADQPIPSLVVNIPSKNPDDKFERSPKTINAGESREDNDYNIRTLNARHSPRNVMNQYYKDSSNDGMMDQTPYYGDQQDNWNEGDRSDPRSIISRSRSPQIAQLYRNKSPYGKRIGAGGTIPFNKMSPSHNYDDMNSSGDKSQDVPYSNFKNYLGNGRTYNRPERSMNTSVNQTVRNPTYQRDDVGNKYNNRTFNNMSLQDIKRMEKRFNKVYNPNKNNYGLLVEESQVTVPGASDEIFNNRYRVLSKMNKLSNILLNRQRRSPKLEPTIEERFGRSFNKDNTTFEREFRDSSYGEPRKNLTRSRDEIKRRAFSRSPDHKFLYVSLAMLSSKGAPKEDKIILRRMRLEKGGVVDLAQEELKKDKYAIKKTVPKKGRSAFNINPKNREKAAKRIQAWWRDIKDLYRSKLNKIIKIQSVWRGKFVRKYMYDLFYLNFLYISFCKKIENVLTNHIRPYVWKKLFGKKEPEPEERPRRDPGIEILKYIIRKDYRSDLNTRLRPAFKKWANIVKKLSDKDKKGRNLVQIRADKENKMGGLRNAFNKWIFIKKILDANDKLTEDTGDQDELTRKKNLRKINGLFKILEGMEKVTEKKAVENVAPKLEDYLRKKAKTKKLIKLLHKKPSYIKKLLRKYLYQWYANSMSRGPEKNTEDDEIKIKEIRIKILKNLVENVRNKQRRNILNKNFYKYLKKIIMLKLKEEKDKLRDKEREFRDKETTIRTEYEERITILENQKKEDDDVRRKIQLALEKMKKDKKKDEDELKKRIDENKNNKDLIYYAKGSEILQRAVWRITHPDPLHAMGEKIDNDYLIKKLIILIKIKREANKRKLREAFNRWKTNALKRVNADLLTLLFVKLLEITCNNARKKILARRLNQWRRFANLPRPYDSLENARKIYEATEIIKHTLINNLGDDFFERLDRTRNPRVFIKPLLKIFRRLNRAKIDKLRRAVNKWRGKNKDTRIKELLTKIMIKNYQKNNVDIRNKILRKYLYRWRNKVGDINIKLIKNTLKIVEIREDETRKLFMRTLISELAKKNRDDLLRKYLKRWQRATNKDKEYEIILKKKIYLLKNIVDRKERDNYVNLLQYFLRWKNRMYELRAIEAPIPFRKTVVSILLTKNDKEELQRYFTRWKYGGLRRLPIMPFIVAKHILKKLFTRHPFNEFVKKMDERNPRVLRQKGSVLINLLENIGGRKPYKHFLIKLRIFNRIKKLDDLQPKIHELVKTYYLRKYLQRWIDNTLVANERRREVLISWLKKRMDKFKRERADRLRYLIDIIFDRADRNNKLLLSYTLLKWSKNARLDEQIENASIIQHFCRRIVDIANQNKILSQKKLVTYILKLKNLKYLNNLVMFGKDLNPALRDYNRLKKIRIDRIRRILVINERLKDLDRLRKALYTWRDNKEAYNKYILIIQKKIRVLLAKKKLDNKRRIIELLLKIYDYRFNNGKDILNYGLHRWSAITRKLACEENAKIIQDFCRSRLDDYLKNKLHVTLDILSKKRLTDLIKKIAYLYTLKMKLKRKPNKVAFDAIKKKALIELIKEILYRVIRNKDDKLRKMLLIHYLKKWIKKVNEYNDRENIAADIIEKVTRGYLLRKYFLLNRKRLRYLRNLFDRVNKMNPKEMLRCTLAKWNKNTHRIICEENAKIIQDFCRDVLDKINQDKLKRNRDNYIILCKKIIKIKVSPKDFMERLKIIKRLEVLKKLGDDLARKRLDNLKYSFEKIKTYPRDKYLLKILEIQENLRKRILRKYLIEWRNKAMRNKLITIFLLAILRKSDHYKQNLLRYNLHKWLCHARYITQEENAKIIQDFCRPIIRDINAARNWHKLSDRLRNLNKIDEIYDIIEKLRILRGLIKLKRILVNKGRRDVMDELLRRYLRYLFIKRIKIIIERFNDNNAKNILRRYFIRWRENAFKLADKENGAKDIMTLLDLLRTRKATPHITNVSILKKFLNDYPKIRAIGFLRKLREFANEKAKNDALARDLLSAKDDLSPKKRLNLIKKLYKIYAYKVFDKLFNTLDDQLRYNADQTKRGFFDKLLVLLMKKTERSYKDQKEGEIKPKNKKTTFRLKKSIKPIEKNRKKLNYVSLIGPFVKYLQFKIYLRKKEAFDELRNKKNTDKFSELYLRWAKKQELPNKRELIEKLLLEYRDAMTRGPLLAKLFKILRHYAIRKIFENAPKIRKVSGMIYVTKMYIMHKKIADKRYLRELIRKWRYYVFSKKLATNKMKSIYKNLHMTYLEMANCLFGNEGSEDPSVIKEFERFGTSVGLWENVKPKKEEKKYCKVVKTQYIFDKLGYPDFQNRFPQTKRVEEKEYTEEKEYKTVYQKEDEKEKEK